MIGLHGAGLTVWLVAHTAVLALEEQLHVVRLEAREGLEALLERLGRVLGLDVLEQVCT